MTKIQALIKPPAPPFIVGELSANHEGNLETMLQLLRKLKEVGASAAKIQTYTPDSMTIKSTNPDFLIHDGLWKGNDLYSLYAEAATPYEWHQTLFDEARSIDLQLFSTPFDEEAVDFLEDLGCPAYKISSFEFTDLPLIKYVAECGKPMILSTGMATFDEIADVVELLREINVEDVTFLHCISAYPSLISDANLLRMLKIRDQFGVDVGLSDHSLGDTAAVVASILGASVIEKHVKLNESDSGPDSSFSMVVNEFGEMIKKITASVEALGDGDEKRTQDEEANLKFRRSIYVVKNVEKGDVVTHENVRKIRPGYGLEPKYLDVVIGKVFNRSMRRGERLSYNDVF